MTTPRNFRLDILGDEENRISKTQTDKDYPMKKSMTDAQKAHIARNKAAKKAGDAAKKMRMADHAKRVRSILAKAKAARKARKGSFKTNVVNMAAAGAAIRKERADKHYALTTGLKMAKAQERNAKKAVAA